MREFAPFLRERRAFSSSSQCSALSSTARPSARCVGSFSDHQLGVARTLAVAVEADIRALGSSLRQLNTLPSVQGLDLDFIGQRVRAAFEAESTSTPNTGTTIELLLP